MILPAGQRVDWGVREALRGARDDWRRGADWEAFEFAERLTVVGRKLQAGEQAPEFTLEHFDPAESAMKQVNLADSAGTVRLLNVVNSLDTPVCHVETRRWEGLRGDLPAGTTVYTISMDLPFAQARWQTAEGV